MKHFPKILILVGIGVVAAIGLTMAIGHFFAPSSKFSQQQFVQELLQIAEHQEANPRITRVGKGLLMEWLIHSPSEFYKNIHKINSYPNKHLHLIFADMKIDEPLAEKIEETQGICGMGFCNCRFALDKKHIFKTNLLMFRDMTVSGSILTHFTLMEDSQVVLHDCDISRKDFRDFVAGKRIKNLFIRTPNAKTLLPVISNMKELRVLFFYDENMGIPDIRLLSQSLPHTEIWVNGENAQELIKATTPNDYNAFSDSIPNPILFAYTGKTFDTDTQLPNNINRWYDFAVGRWLSTDPIGFWGKDTNLYRYCYNNSPRNIDPMGTDWLDCMAACITDNDSLP
ncbi:MAG: RHS repeat-associated core domain-containing protein [Planctomycetia bacterium]|nr:RHS repeat-associated core domain-containing protein [Planctomycetia bacterium]